MHSCETIIPQGGEGVYTLYYLALTYLMARHRNSACFIATMNRLPYTFSFIFFGILTLVCTYIGLSYFEIGIWGLVLIPLVVQSLYNNWKWNQVVNRYLKTTEYRLMKQGTHDLWQIIRRKLMKGMV